MNTLEDIIAEMKRLGLDPAFCEEIFQLSKTLDGISDLLHMWDEEPSQRDAIIADLREALEDSKTFRLKIDEKFMETCATGTLIGTLATKFDVPLVNMKKIVLIFPKAHLEWCRKHNGPPQWVHPEFAIPLLLEDILKLQKLGSEIIVEYITENPIA